jgi:hypothetical protein
MTKIAKPLALVGLALTILPPLLIFVGAMELNFLKPLMLIGMVLWYLGATPWLGISSSEEIPNEDTHPKI